MLIYDSAIEAKRNNNLAEWLLQSVHDSESDNDKLLSYIKSHPDQINGPVLVDLENIIRTVGPEPSMLNNETEDIFKSSVEAIADRIKTENIAPVLFCENYEGRYYLLDGNHTFEALKKAGANQFWIVYTEDRVIHDLLTQQ